MLRDGTVDDAAAVAALTLRVWPDVIATPETVRYGLEHRLERGRMRCFAWDEDGGLVGWATGGRAWYQERPDVGFASAAVDPAHRGRGVGGALLAAAERHLAEIGIGIARAGSLDDPSARALAERNGYVEVGSSSVSAVDPRRVEPRPVPLDVEVRPLCAFDDPRALYELDQELTRDIPGEPPEAVTLDAWLTDWWHGPMLDLEASMAALVGGKVVALTMLRLDRDSGRAQNNLAGTRQGHRGRGLAALVKSHSLAQAARLGATVAFTSNEERNAAMLAVNRSLGYRPFARRLEWERRAAGR